MHVLKINGTEKSFAKGDLPGTLMELLAHMKINHATVVAEIDGKIVNRSDFADTPLSDGQSVELVRFVGGG